MFPTLNSYLTAMCLLYRNSNSSWCVLTIEAIAAKLKLARDALANLEKPADPGYVPMLRHVADP